MSKEIEHEEPAEEPADKDSQEYREWIEQQPVDSVPRFQSWLERKLHWWRVRFNQLRDSYPTLSAQPRTAKDDRAVTTVIEARTIARNLKIEVADTYPKDGANIADVCEYLEGMLVQVRERRASAVADAHAAMEHTIKEGSAGAMRWLLGQLRGRVAMAPVELENSDSDRSDSCCDFWRRADRQGVKGMPDFPSNAMTPKDAERFCVHLLNAVEAHIAPPAPVAVPDIADAAPHAPSALLPTPVLPEKAAPVSLPPANTDSNSLHPELSIAMPALEKANNTTFELTYAQACERMKVQDYKLTRLIKGGVIVSSGSGKGVMINKASVDRYIVDNPKADPPKPSAIPLAMAHTTKRWMCKGCGEVLEMDKPLCKKCLPSPGYDKIK